MFSIPFGLTFLSAAIILVGFRLSARAMRPKLLRAGVVTTAAGLTLLWVLPVWLFDDLAGEWGLPVFIGAMFVAVSVLALGLQLVARACGAPEESGMDRILHDLATHNDLS